MGHAGNGVSTYLSCLPAIFNNLGDTKDGSVDGHSLGALLLAFERVLTGDPEQADRAHCRSQDQSEQGKSATSLGLEEIIANIPNLFRPHSQQLLVKSTRATQWDAEARQDEEATDDGEVQRERAFLQWLAWWGALTLRTDWPPQKQKDVLSKIIPLYKGKGTKANLIKLLKIYAGEDSDPKVIEEEYRAFQIGDLTPQVGTDTIIPFRISKGVQVGDQMRRLGGPPPFYFKVEITIPRNNDNDKELIGEVLKRQYEVVSALVDLHKPAHAHFKIDFNVETVQIGNRNRCIINDTMVIGNIKKNSSCMP